ncbi:11-beta-hydroxysteroid dehydrogenase-like 4A [Rutidosis leptorrhynchoides]|uniref:11-beta-hydroxysteroid dehydrogenase-like 4A n=1 Tax=Rutidosis leptorrhynchoides TaxID=125765 RepID=UPI003A999306
MALIHNILNIFSPIISIILFIFVLPLLTLYRLLRFCVKSIFCEKLAGKVVIITGASSGIGEHLAYEYAKHGAKLALVARREGLLVDVARKAKMLGSPDVIVIKGDVLRLEDCRRFVDKTINHFGKLDCLVNNAGIITIGLFQDQQSLTDDISVMDVNFWGSVNATHVALPHLKKSKGKIVVTGSCGGWFNTPRLSVYNASKAAQQSFFETLRVECGSDVTITMATLGVVNTELANKYSLKQGNLEWLPLESVEECAKAIVNSVRRGDEYLVEPKWMGTVFIWAMLFPEIVNTVRRSIVRQHMEEKTYSRNSLLQVLHFIGRLFSYK